MPGDCQSNKRGSWAFREAQCSPPPEQFLHPLLDQEAGNELSRLKNQAHVPSPGRQDTELLQALSPPLLSSDSSESTRPAGFPGHTLSLKAVGF